MPTVPQLAARMNRDVAESLKRNVLAVPADKQEWKPLDAGRSVLSQITECAVITQYVVMVLKDRAVPADDGGDGYTQAVRALDTPEKAVTALDAGIEALAAAIEEFPAGELDTLITLPFFPTPMSFADVMFIPYWNNVYHGGQIAYIQTLYGDNEMH